MSQESRDFGGRASRNWLMESRSYVHGSAERFKGVGCQEQVWPPEHDYLWLSHSTLTSEIHFCFHLARLLVAPRDCFSERSEHRQFELDAYWLPLMNFHYTKCELHCRNSLSRPVYLLCYHMWLIKQLLVVSSQWGKSSWIITLMRILSDPQSDENIAGSKRLWQRQRKR